MKQFLRRHLGLHLWLLALGVALALYYGLRGQRPLMNALAVHVTGPVKRALGRFWSHIPLSGMEVLLFLAAVGVVVYLIAWLAAIIRSRQKGSTVYGGFMGLVCAGLTVYVLGCLLWGVNYYTDSFQDLSGIRAQAVSEESLYRVTALFAEKLNETADGVERNGSGVFAESRSTIFHESAHVYDRLEEAFPFLAFDDLTPKRMLLSRVMSAMDFTGVYCGFTGESNVNVDAPACLLPATIAHELGHQRGFASEQECNFLAVLASTTSGDPTYEYSGWLLGYIHLSNALYSQNQKLWQQVWDSLPEGARADIRFNNAYWESFQGPAAEASRKVYDTYLKSNGQADGMKSYGTVVDLLVAYYQ